MTGKLNDTGFNELIITQRKQRTPSTVAYESIGIAREYWLWFSKDDEGAVKFIEAWIDLKIESPATNGDLSARYIKTLVTDDLFYLNGMFFLNEDAATALLQVMEAVISYSAQAIQSEKIGEHVLAWTYACDAQYWSGILKAAIIQRLNPNPLSINGLKAALAKLANDPKQEALKEIEMEFHKVSSKFKRHGYGADFCRKMQDKYPIILDHKTIPKLVTRLKKSIPL